MRNALVTGGNGFIGRHLVKALRQRNFNVYTLGRRGTSDAGHFTLEGAAWNTDALADIIRVVAPRYIFHLAGVMHGTLDEMDRTNLGLTQTLFRTLEKTEQRPLLVIAGSAAEYGSAVKDGEPVEETLVCAPLSDYGKSKHRQTREALNYASETGNPVLVARIFNPLGCGMPPHLAIPDFARQLASMTRSSGELCVGNIDVRRDMIDVEHIATLLCRLAENPAARGIVNICSGQAPLLRDLVEMLIGDFGKKVDFKVDRTRLRGNEMKTLIGSTRLLSALGCAPPVTDFPAVIARISRSVREGVAHPS
jgi:GDP-4-dehydro-6-deoxy-D-mannose reductase